VKVVGTAGHIDHGKSTLVQRLTGVDPDRLEEEKRRGMTIDLGFAHLRLPDGQTVSIVDVPGHERFVSNMLAGAGGIDMALLVVAADEAVMPQTREHVQILDLLGINRAVVALTKTDLVDSDMMELAAEDVASLLEGTTLAGSRIVPVSAVTGMGVEDLLEALSATAADTPVREDRGLPFLPIDRVFTVAGFGTVVTGTLHDGVLEVGDDVEVVPAGRKARIRSLQVHSSPVNRGLPGSRLAANLAGIERQDVARGDVLTLPGRVPPTRRFDALVKVVGDAAVALKHGQEVALHVGSGEYQATVSLLGPDLLEPGDSGWAQIRARTLIPAVRGQRFIVRLPAPARTIAGGVVVDTRPRHRRNDERAVLRLDALTSGGPDRAVEAALAVPRLVSVGDVAETTGLSQAVIAGALERAVVSGTAVRVGGRFAGSELWETMSHRAASVLGRFHAENPLRRGMTREELRRKLHRSREDWPAWLDSLIARGVIVADGPVVALQGFTSAGAARRAEADRVRSILAAASFAPPSARELETLAGTDAAMLSSLAESGEIVHIGGGLYFAPDAYERLVCLALELIDRDGSVSMAAFRDAAGTSRKYAQAFLEHLDARRITRRVGDVRVRGREAPACV
jgi:selenocysteine-specific elongation factor